MDGVRGLPNLGSQREDDRAVEVRGHGSLLHIVLLDGVANALCSAGRGATSIGGIFQVFRVSMHAAPGA